MDDGLRNRTERLLVVALVIATLALAGAVIAQAILTFG